MDLIGNFNPAGAPGNLRRVPDWRQPGWAEVFSSFDEVEGALYYGYYFYHHEGSSGEPSILLVMALGDLDGDGVPSIRWDYYLRNPQGSHQQVGRYPATPDLDDTGSF